MRTPGLFFSLTHTHMLQMSWYKKTFMSIWRHPTTEMFAILFLLHSFHPCGEIDFESSDCVSVLSSPIRNMYYSVGRFFFSHKCPLTLLPANRAKSPPKRGLGAFRVILFVLCVCLLPYREHWIWSYDCRASVADRHIAGHCQLSNHPSLCSLAMDYPNCSWCQQWASCSEKYAR